MVLNLRGSQCHSQRALSSALLKGREGEGSPWKAAAHCIKSSKSYCTLIAMQSWQSSCCLPSATQQVKLPESLRTTKCWVRIKEEQQLKIYMQRIMDLQPNIVNILTPILSRFDPGAKYCTYACSMLIFKGKQTVLAVQINSKVLY